MKILTLAFYFLMSISVDVDIITFESPEKDSHTSHYTGCPDGPEGLQMQTLRLTEAVISSQRPNRVQKRAELNMGTIAPEQIRKLEGPNDLAACDQINQFLNENQVGIEDENLSPIFYEAGGFYFASFGVQTGSMLGFVPVYMFDHNFELVFIWVG